MAKSRNQFTPVLIRSDDNKADRNLSRTTQALDRISPAAVGVITGNISLQVGTNRIKPPIKKPQGRYTVFQSGAADISDVGLDGSGFWVVTSTAAVTVRFSFF